MYNYVFSFRGVGVGGWEMFRAHTSLPSLGVIVVQPDGHMDQQMLEANITNLGQVFCNIRAFAAITRGAIRHAVLGLQMVAAHPTMLFDNLSLQEQNRRRL